MVILFIFAGFVSGAIAASITIWSGGAVLSALFAYSVFGALGAVCTATTVFFLGASEEMQPGHSTHEEKAKSVVSA